MREILVGEASAFADRERKIVVDGETEIGVFKIAGAYYAWENQCPHMGGPVCQGKILNRVTEVLDAGQKSLGMQWVEEDVHVVCPWHGFEFNLRTGTHPGDANTRLKGFKTILKEGHVYVVLPV